MAGVVQFAAFVLLPGSALLVAILLSVYEVYELGERKLLLLIAILALMLQHQLLEALTFLETGAVGEATTGELLETGANLLAAGSVYYVLSFARRERELVERYERSRDQYQQLIAATPVAILIYCEGTVRFANGAAVDLFDAEDAAALTGTVVADLVADGDETAFRERVEQARTAGDSLRPTQVELATLSGERRYGLLTAAPASVYGEDAVQVVVQDVTERKRAQDRLAEASARLQTIVDSIHDAVLIADPAADEFVDCNRRACELLGYSREELLDLGPTDIHPHEPDAYRSFVEAVQEVGPTTTDTLSCCRKDGSTVDAEVAATTTELDGDEVLLVTVRDISERLRRERQIQLLQRVLRHNIRNDMMAVIGRADLVEEQGDGAVAEHGSRIRELARGLVETSDKIRTLNEAIDRERRSLASTTDLATHAEQVLRTYEDEADAHEFSWTLPQTAPVQGDESIRWAVENLVENAVEHTPAGTTVTVSVTAGDDWVELSVADDGPGIPDSERAVVTRETDPTQIHHGSGVGLWIVAQLAEAFDGEFSIADDPGPDTGTEITLRLPRAEQSREAARSTAEG